MFARFAKAVATALLITVLATSPALAQGQQQQQGKPVGQYILLVVLMAIPIGLVCRSSRR